MAWLRTLSRSSSCPPKLSPFGSFRFSSLSTPPAAAKNLSGGLDPTVPGKEKPRVVVLGTGWTGCRLMKGIDTSIYDVVCVSPRNHMVFTPLLAKHVRRHARVPLRRRAHRTDPARYLQRSGLLLLPSKVHLPRRRIPHGLSEDEKRRLLHCAVIGGGPTGVEFSGELSDFITKDVRERYSHVKDYIHVTLIEANEILSSLDVRLRQYATNQLTKSGVQLMRGVVKDVQPKKIVLNDGTEVPYGLLVWSTGVGPSPFVSSTQLQKAPGGRIGVDEWLRVPSVQDVFAVGDCGGFLESTGKPVLPALAQVAERQGMYLAKLLNRIGKAGGGHPNSLGKVELGDPFVYRHLGSMATVGRYKALVDLRQSKEGKGLSLAGFASWFIWHSAYLTRVVSWRNRFYVAINWFTTLVFGRDISCI